MKKKRTSKKRERFPPELGLVIRLAKLDASRGEMLWKALTSIIVRLDVLDKAVIAIEAREKGKKR